MVLLLLVLDMLNQLLIIRDTSNILDILNQILILDLSCHVVGTTHVINYSSMLLPGAGASAAAAADGYSLIMIN